VFISFTWQVLAADFLLFVPLRDRVTLHTPPAAPFIGCGFLLPVQFLDVIRPSRPAHLPNELNKNSNHNKEIKGE
jgi:hypothetical protein